LLNFWKEKVNLRVFFSHFNGVLDLIKIFLYWIYRSIIRKKSFLLLHKLVFCTILLIIDNNY
jgi:hypothetical protein